MNNLRIAFLAVGLPLCFAASANAQQAKDDAMKNCPMHKEHAAADAHHAVVEKHGDQAMGFSHETTTHHFRLAPSGGAIEVTANDPNDKASAEAIRSHLAKIAELFHHGDFSAPAFIHDGIPPGVTTMKLLQDKIRYEYATIPAGARVRIESGDPIAVAAIQDFLRFQITEHRTGDTLTVEAAQ